MLSALLPPDRTSLFELLQKDPDTILDLAALVNCLGTCSLCERQFVPTNPFVESLSELYGNLERLHHELRSSPYVSYSNSLCGFCHNYSGFLNMFEKIRHLNMPSS